MCTTSKCWEDVTVAVTVYLAEEMIPTTTEKASKNSRWCGINMFPIEVSTVTSSKTKLKESNFFLPQVHKLYSRLTIGFINYWKLYNVS